MSARGHHEAIRTAGGEALDVGAEPAVGGAPRRGERAVWDPLASTGAPISDGSARVSWPTLTVTGRADGVAPRSKALDSHLRQAFRLLV